MSDFENLDYYELLGVPRTATPDEIKRAYRREISKYHPDRFVHGSAEEQAYASRRSQNLTAAYSVLSDFAARSDYNRGQPVSQAANRATRPATPPAAPRDHQAELYEQAQEHLAAGRMLQAISALRQLQQINPFYRDSAKLLANAEAHTHSQATPPARRKSRPLLIAGGAAGGIALAALAAWAISMRGATASQPPAEVSTAVAAVVTVMPTQALAPTATSAVAPTSAPTVAPTTAPTAAPSSTAAPTVAPSATPALETGELLFADDFSGDGWADLSGSGWQVGYQNERYQVRGNQGVGTIWSYRSGRERNASIGVDVQVARGEAGLLLRFLDASNYLSVSLNPSQTSFRIEQHAAGVVTVLGGGQSGAITTGTDAINRLVVQLSGDNVQVFANGQLLAAADAPDAPNSIRYGLLVNTNAGPSTAFFDNLAIRRLGG